MASLPDFDSIALQLRQAGVKHSPSELHGLQCGLLATGHGQADAEVLGVMAAHADLPGGFPQELADNLLLLRKLSAAGFDDQQMALPVFLPDDDEELGVRVAAIGQWAEGFLVGFGTGCANTRDSDLSTAVQEALSDLAAISQVALPDDDGEEEEEMLIHIVDHCRMATLMIHAELVLKPDTSTPASPAPVTHH